MTYDEPRIVTARPPTRTNRTRPSASAVRACSKSIECAAPNVRSFEGLTAYGLHIVDGPLQVAHALLRGLAKTLDEQSQVDAVGARRLDATVRRRVEQSLFGAAHGLYCIATFLFMSAFISDARSLHVNARRK